LQRLNQQDPSKDRLKILVGIQCLVAATPASAALCALAIGGGILLRSPHDGITVAALLVEQGADKLRYAIRGAGPAIANLPASFTDFRNIALRLAHRQNVYTAVVSSHEPTPMREALQRCGDHVNPMAAIICHT
jgi:hypothetical protein